MRFSKHSCIVGIRYAVRISVEQMIKTRLDVHYHEICVQCGADPGTESVRAVCTQIQQQTK